ncbi:NTP transferase domain-containing protein [Streptomyces sp. NPDC006655]|uniref:NTP transferase domain-containing protein n=1 Tax=Streptomyces sp. NPDC006655 TaxID=3156898 RepID=UPI0034546805
MTFLQPPVLAVMAGGAGTRLRECGIEVPKALLRIGRQTILERLLDQACSVGIREVLIASGPDRDDVDALLSEDSRFESTVLHTPRRGTLHAVRALVREIGGREHVLTTSDAVLSDNALAGLLQHVRDDSGQATMMNLLVTPAGEDRSPIYVRDIGPSGYAIEKPGRSVTPSSVRYAGMRWCSAGMHEALGDPNYDSLVRDSDFLTRFSRREPGSISITHTDFGIDVDDCQDLWVVCRALGERAPERCRTHREPA